jgi:succinate dehydrogenase/fumarate reductase cytochrome b subunit
MESLFSAPQVPNPVDATSFGQLFSSLIGTLLLWAGAVTLLFIIIGGFRYIFSMGNQESVENARNTVLYAILGAVIIYLSYLFVSYLLDSFLGVLPAYQISPQ